jgi:hypothetical protein
MLTDVTYQEMLRDFGYVTKMHGLDYEPLQRERDLYSEHRGMHGSLKFTKDLEYTQQMTSRKDFILCSINQELEKLIQDRR